MGNLQMENISEALKNVEDVESLRDIPEEHREEFTVFMRLMKARALDEIEEISDETILVFLKRYRFLRLIWISGVFPGPICSRGFIRRSRQGAGMSFRKEKSAWKCR